MTQKYQSELSRGANKKIPQSQEIQRESQRQFVQKSYQSLFSRSKITVMNVVQKSVNRFLEHLKLE